MRKVLLGLIASLFLSAPAWALDNFFCVHLTSDIINIPDCVVTGSLPACHTRLLFDTGHAALEPDSVGWDMTNAQFMLPAGTPKTTVIFTFNLSWTAPTSAGYAKAWVHLQDSSLAVDQGYGEGRRDGFLSAANPGINATIPVRVSPGQMVHLAFEGFSGSGSHAIQAGSSDRPQDTQYRSRFCGFW